VTSSFSGAATANPRRKYAKKAEHIYAKRSENDWLGDEKWNPRDENQLDL